MATYRADAVVLRTWKLGEADRIVNLLTRDRGKVRAVAKGVRKPKSRFGGRVQPSWHLRIQCYEGRSLDTITQVETIDPFANVRSDLDRLTKASILLEASDQIAQEEHPDPGLYTMLVGALSALDGSDSAMLVPSFLLKALAHEGVGPVLDCCVMTGATDELVSFDVQLGGLVSATTQRGRRISPEAVDLLRRTLGGGLAGVLREAESPATHEVSDIAVRLYEHHVERRLRAAHVFDVT
jgi:DNA repair protein RecO (recombination protein O)